MIRGGARYIFAKDHLGSIKAVINVNTGATEQLIHYDEFGRILSDSNPGFQPFGYAGGHYDHQTGLVRFGARDYDPDLGRWLSKDPILFDGGDTNLYGYVLNDPVNLVDPSGKIALPAFAGIAIGGAMVFLAYEVYKNPETRNMINNYIQNKLWHLEHILDPNYTPPPPPKPRPATDTKREIICGR